MTKEFRAKIRSWIVKFKREERRLPMCKEISARWGVSYAMAGRILKEHNNEVESPRERNIPNPDTGRRRRTDWRDGAGRQ